MNLHTQDDSLFNELIYNTAATFGLEEYQVEKDYYVSLLLKKIAEVSPEIVFKGGTSLSKCYDVIKRFSEDIDLNIRVDERISRTQKKKLKEGILAAIESVEMKFLNDIVEPVVENKSNWDFNKYLVGYSKAQEGETFMINHIIVETNVTYRAFPCEELNVSNYITKYLEQNHMEELILTYDLKPFPIKVQTIERTFIDKIFAICDYHEMGNYNRYSRHIYDIHKIWESGLVTLDKLKAILPEVIEIRRPGRDTISCKSGYELVKTLEDIIISNSYKNDYDTNTTEFLAEILPYEEAIKSLKSILQSGILPHRIA